jgi:hypothetical protein
MALLSRENPSKRLLEPNPSLDFPLHDAMNQPQHNAWAIVPKKITSLTILVAHVFWVYHDSSRATRRRVKPLAILLVEQNHRSIMLARAC